MAYFGRFFWQVPIYKVTKRASGKFDQNNFGSYVNLEHS